MSFCNTHKECEFLERPNKHVPFGQESPPNTIDFLCSKASKALKTVGGLGLEVIPLYDCYYRKLIKEN